MLRRLLASLGAGMLACGGGDGKVADGPRGARGRAEEVPFQVLEGGPPGHCLSRPVEAVIRGAEEWERLWSAAAGCADSAWAVDFPDEMVLVYALGETYTGSVKLRMDNLRAAPGGPLVAYLTVTSPARGCPARGDVVYPRVVVRTPQRAGEVRFLVTRRTDRCR